MNWLVYHIVSGQSFFTGVVLLVVAAFASTRPSAFYRRLTVLGFLIGLIAVVVSSTPLPLWYCVVLGAATLVWMASGFRASWRPWAARAMAMAWLIAVLMELPYHFTPTFSSTEDQAVAIIGDSVTAGVGGGETSETWPSILAREHSLEVQDISHMGETAKSALKRASAVTINAPVVVVEIGGNDVLGSTTVQQFKNDLDALLAHLTTPERQIVMFELPLPPFYHEYGRTQREIAAKYHVKLIPKRVFLSVLAGDDSTLDTIHLSQAGHQRMANTVWRVIGPAYE